jgi:O-antigen/teichoic acid export membrane protein
MADVKKGAAIILAAKLIFMVSGYALYIGLGRMLPTETFGVYGVVFAVVSLINMVVINGTMQTISRFVASHPLSGAGIRRRGFLYQLLFATVLLSAYVLGAPLIGKFFNDPSLVPLFRLSAVITGIYAFYAVNVGYLNGRKLFVRQASLDIVFSILKVSFILALVYKGLAIHGVIIGFAAAALCVLVVSFFLAGFSFSGPAAQVGPSAFARFAFSVMAVALLLNAVMNTDLFLLKRLAPVDLANTWAGHYTAAQSIARIPYFLMVTATLVLFPVIASLHGDDERTRTRRREATTQALSMIAVLLIGMASVTVPIAEKIVLVLYPERYADAGPVLAWLIVAVCMLALVNVTVTLISGGGRPMVSAGILGAMLVLQAGAASVLIPLFGGKGAAMATTGAGVVGFLASFLWCKKAYGTRLPPWAMGVAAKVAFTVATLSYAYGALFPNAGRIATVLFCAVAFTLFLALCAVGGVLLGVLPQARRTLWVTKPLDPPFNDGSKVLPRSLLAQLPADQMAICVAKRPKPGVWPEDLQVVRAYSAANSFGGRLMQNARIFLYLLVARFHYKQIHFFFAPNPTTSTVIKWLNRLSPGVRFVQTVMSRPRHWEGVERLLFGKIIVAQSEDARKRLASAAPKRDVRLIRPGVRLDDVPLKKDNGGSDEKHLLFAGDIDHGGAMPHLKTIIPELLNAHPNLRFIFSVRLKGIETRVKAEEFMTEVLADFGDRVEMHVDHPDFPTLLDRQDAMIFPAEDLYTKVDAPLVILETLARGIPVFMLDRPPLSEIVDGDLAEKLIGESADALKDRIAAWLEGQAEITPQALKAQVEARFSAAKAAEAHRLLYSVELSSSQA